MIKKIKEYIKKNATPLFKTNEEKSLKAIFDKKGFWFHEITQSIYNKIKSQPHIYVAFNKHGYYIGISNQSGGRWKRQHAYHLGTLAYHLLGTLNKYDQNHLHWVEAWMKIGSKKIDTFQNAILLKEEVHICFIPFKFYSEFNNLHKGNSLPPKNIISKINNELETALIQSFKEDGKKLLNVKKSMKKAVIQTKTNGMKTPPPQKPKILAGADFFENNGCVEFKVNRDQNICQEAQKITNLPKGKCSIELFSNNKKDVRQYINNFTRKTSRTVSEYFNSTDTNNGNVARWKIVKDEMNTKKKIIETITVRVCSIMPAKTK
jgi:hypothetical protein